jgi:hypothetical protein
MTWTKEFRPIGGNADYFHILKVFLIGALLMPLFVYGIDKSALPHGAKWTAINLLGPFFAALTFREIAYCRRWYLLIVAICFYSVLIALVFLGSGVWYYGV